jgi:hypothetical protein
LAGNLLKALIDPASARSGLSGVAAGELARRGAKRVCELEGAEARWLEASETLERQVA